MLLLCLRLVFALGLALFPFAVVTGRLFSVFVFTQLLEFSRVLLPGCGGPPRSFGTLSALLGPSPNLWDPWSVFWGSPSCFCGLFPFRADLHFP